MTQPRANTLLKKMGFMDQDLKRPKHDEIMIWLNNIINSQNLMEWINIPDLFDHRFSDNSKYLIDKYKNFSPGFSYLLPEAEKRLNEGFIHWPEKWRQEEIRSTEEFIIEHKKLIENEMSIKKLFTDEYLISIIPRKPIIKIIEKKWDKPITSGSNYIIGFIDLSITYEDYYIEIDLNENDIYKTFTLFEFELKWRILPKNKEVYFEVKTEIPSLGELIRQINTYRNYVEGKFIVVCPDDRYKELLAEQGIGFVKYPLGTEE
ncbi:MAG: hypothetical protein HYZ21_11580 [Chloroflexi bacterium]|nr:hypothetical protein [Chloroflexota bacterium]